MSETVKPSELDELTGDPEDSSIITITYGGKTYKITIADFLTRCVKSSLFDANTILAANTDDTPAAVTVAEQRIVGRITSGNITALTAAEVNTLLGTSGIQVAEVTASNANLLRSAFKTTPITLVAAPGANKIIIPIFTVGYCTGTTYFNYRTAGDAWITTYVGWNNGGTFASAHALYIGVTNGATNWKHHFVAIAANILSTDIAIENMPLIYYANGTIDDTKGADGDGDIKFRVYYKVEDFS